MSVVIHKVGLNKTTGQKSEDYLTTDLVGYFDPSTGVETEYWDNQVGGGANLRRFNSIATAGSAVTYWAFDGSDDYLGEADTGYGGSPFQLNVANDFTLIAWTRLSASSSQKSIHVFNLGDATSGGLSLIVEEHSTASNGSRLHITANNEGFSSDYLTKFDIEKWHCVAVVKKGNVFSFYLNGSFLSSHTKTGVTGTLNLEVGKGYSEGTSVTGSNSLIGIVLVYDNDITNSQLRQNFLATHDITDSRVYGGTYSAS